MGLLVWSVVVVTMLLVGGGGHLSCLPGVVAFQVLMFFLGGEHLALGLVVWCK